MWNIHYSYFFLLCSVLLTFSLPFPKWKEIETHKQPTLQTLYQKWYFLIDDKVDGKIYMDHADC